MGYGNVEISCRGCGAPLNISDVKCSFCHGPVNITSMNSVYEMPIPMVNKYAGSYKKDIDNNPEDINASKSAAFCYLRLKLYDKAMEHFEKSIEENFDDGDLYYYAALCLLKGKRPFMQQKNTIDKAIEYLNAACFIENKGIYHYFMAYLKYDYYNAKHLNISPNFIEELGMAGQLGVPNMDITRLYEELGASRPNGF